MGESNAVVLGDKESWGRYKIKHNFPSPYTQGSFVAVVTIGVRVWAVIVPDGADEPKLVLAESLLIHKSEWIPFERSIHGCTVKEV